MGTPNKPVPVAKPAGAGKPKPVPPPAVREETPPPVVRRAGGHVDRGDGRGWVVGE